MARSFENFEREVQVAEFLGVGGDEARQKFIADGGKLVLAFAAERENFAEQERKPAGTSTFERILTFFKSLDGFWVQYDFCVCGVENFVQESGMIVVRVREENVADFFRTYVKFL